MLLDRFLLFHFITFRMAYRARIKYNKYYVNSKNIVIYLFQAKTKEEQEVKVYACLISSQNLCQIPHGKSH